jgi:hypothetical protein
MHLDYRILVEERDLKLLLSGDLDKLFHKTCQFHEWNSQTLATIKYRMIEINSIFGNIIEIECIHSKPIPNPEKPPPTLDPYNPYFKKLHLSF